MRLLPNSCLRLKSGARARLTRARRRVPAAKTTAASSSTARSRASKGSGGKGAARTTFSFKDIRLQGARWRHLFLLGRIYQPASWRTVADVEPAVWLGYVARADYVAALDADGRPHHVPQDATVTPGSDRSWLSKAVRWTKLADLSLAWWEQHVEGAV